MSSVTEGNLGLNYGWAYGESGWNTGMDDNLVKLGFTSRNQVKGILSAPPSTPSNGDAYIVGTSPTGLFSGNFGKVAIWDRTVWLFLTPKNQEVVFNTSDGCDYIYNNGWSLKLEAEVSPYIKIKDFTFSTGYTITDQKQCLLNITDNHYYQWNGTLPKVVSAGSTPATSGGIAAGAWIDRTDMTLRSDLNIIVKVFESVANMVSDASLVVGQKCRTLGYYAVGDGGANDYEIVAAATGTDDGGSYIDLSGSGCQAEGLFLDGVVNVKRFGAVGDGVTDDQLKIQAAVNYIPSVDGFLLFNGGCKYKVKSPVIFSSKNSFTIKMDGYVKYEAIAPTFSIGTSAAFVLNGCNDWVFEPRFRLDTSGERGVAIELTNCDGWTISNGDVKLVNTTESVAGVFLVVRQNVTNGSIVNNNIHCGWGILSNDESGVSDIQIAGNCFVGGDGVTVADVIEFNQPNNKAKNITINGNTILNCSNIGVGFANVDYVSVTGNVIRNCGNDAIHIEDDSEFFTFTGNTVDGCEGACISLTDGVKKGVVSCNSLNTGASGTNKVVIRVTGSISKKNSDLIISDNIIDGVAQVTTSYCVLWQYTNNSVLKNNKIFNGNRGAYIDDADGYNIIHKNHFYGFSIVGLNVGNVAPFTEITDNTYENNSGFNFVDNTTGTLYLVREVRDTLPSGRKSYYRAGARILKPRATQNSLLPEIGWYNLTSGYDGTWQRQGKMYSDSDPSRGYWSINEIIYTANPAASGFIGRVCTIKGTSGTYSEGLTCDANGTDTVRLSGTTSVLVVGDTVTINATVRRIIDINGTSMRLDGIIPSGSTLSIAYRNPTFKTFGVISA